MRRHAELDVTTRAMDHLLSVSLAKEASVRDLHEASLQPQPQGGLNRGQLKRALVGSLAIAAGMGIGHGVGKVVGQQVLRRAADPEKALKILRWAKPALTLGVGGAAWLLAESRRKRKESIEAAARKIRYPAVEKTADVDMDRTMIGGGAVGGAAGLGTAGLGHMIGAKLPLGKAALVGSAVGAWQARKRLKRLRGEQ